MEFSTAATGDGGGRSGDFSDDGHLQGDLQQSFSEDDPADRASSNSEEGMKIKQAAVKVSAQQFTISYLKNLLKIRADPDWKEISSNWKKILIIEQGQGMHTEYACHKKKPSQIFLFDQGIFHMHQAVLPTPTMLLRHLVRLNFIIFLMKILKVSFLEKPFVVIDFNKPANKTPEKKTNLPTKENPKCPILEKSDGMHK